MKKLLFWTEDNIKDKNENSIEYKKFKKLENFFNKINFKIEAIKENFSCTNYPVINLEKINEYDYDYIVCSLQSIAQLKKFNQNNNINNAQIVVLSYDLNQIQCDLGVNYPDILFYEQAKIENNTLITKIKELKILGKHIKELPSPADETTQERVVKECVNSYLLAKKVSTSVKTMYQTGENWGNFLKATRKDFYNAIGKQDTKFLIQLFKNFCRNSLTTGTLGGKDAFDFFENSPGYSRWLTHNFKVWKESLNEKELDISELGLPATGNPYGVNIEGHIINVNSFLFNYRANFCKKITQNKTKSLIMEIGGGFGGLGYYLHKIKTNCTYIDLDIPENLIVTEYFLKITYPDKKILTLNTEDINSIDLSKDNLLKYDIVLLPNFMLPYFKENSIDLIINTISLGEMGYDTICEYIEQIDRVGRKYFYHENIANTPPYNGFPVSVYPEMKNFKQIHSTISRWDNFDAYSKDYIYTENLFIKDN